jgi:transaldolase
MSANPLLALSELGQSIWMDFLDRRSIASGQLERYIRDDGVRGVTSNPTIFEKAIGGSHDYDTSIRELARAGKSTTEIYQAITVGDIQLAADLFRPVFERQHGTDGFVSLEVSPHLAHQTSATVAEAHDLWTAVNRPNLMIKVPATVEGLPAIAQLVGEGVNVNITLLFSLRRYEEVALAYLAGLESRSKLGLPPTVASVASFFLSRIDTLLDSELDELAADGSVSPELSASLRGRVAIASARLAYQTYKQLFSGERFRKLAHEGARSQRLLWASTGTKNPAYSDVKYVEPLVGRNTINTMTLDTLSAYRDHGAPALRLDDEADEARQILHHLEHAGIALDDVTRRLEDDGVRKFIEAHDGLMKVIAERRAEALREVTESGAHRGAP